MAKKELKITLVVLFLFLQLIISFTYHSKSITAAKPLENVQGIFLVADFSDYREFQIPKEILEDLGCKITVVGPNYTVISGGGPDIEVDILIDDINNLSRYEFLYTPGGGGVATIIDYHPEALELVVEAYNYGLVMAAICAGPVVFAYADIISGRNISGNIGIRTEILQAGANFIPDEIVIDDPFVTCDVVFVYTIAQQGIVKALGLFETDPPILHSYNSKIVQTGSNNSLYIIVNASDYFGVASVIVEFNKYNSKLSQYESAFEFDLTENQEDNTFSGAIYQIPDGNYSVSIIAEDILGNIAEHLNLFSFVIGNSSNLAISMPLLFSSLVFCIIISYIVNKKKAKK